MGPIAVYSPVVLNVLNTTDPVLMPMQKSRGMGILTWGRSSWIRRLMSRAARRACSASSSRAWSAPQKAITESPMCLSMRPPRCRMMRSMRLQSRLSSSVIFSASRCSESCVKSVMSAKSTVICLRCSVVVGGRRNRVIFSRNARIAVSATAVPSCSRCCSRVRMACWMSSLSLTRRYSVSDQPSLAVDVAHPD